MAKGVKGTGGKPRVTLFIKPESIKKLDHIFKAEGMRRGENLARTDIINEAVEDYISRWEKKHGVIKVK